MAMFNRFTERARKVILLAKEEAKRFNHDYIGTEHILLGLVREGEGVAAAVLASFDIYASAGGQNKAIAQPFTTTADSSGQIVIQFTAVTENPKVNGISINPNTNYEKEKIINCLSAYTNKK